MTIDIANRSAGSSTLARTFAGCARAVLAAGLFFSSVLSAQALRTPITQTAPFSRANTVAKVANSAPLPFALQKTVDAPVTIFVRPGGTSYNFSIANGAGAGGAVSAIQDIGFQNVTAFNWILTRGQIQHSTDGGASWTPYVIQNNNVSAYLTVAGRLWRFVDSMPGDSTTTNTVGNSWHLVNAPGSNTSAGGTVIPDNAPTDIVSNKNTLFSNAVNGAVVAKLTPTDTGASTDGFWVIDSQSVPNLFTLAFNRSTGNTATVTLGAGTLPALGQTATLTARYYDLYQTDASGNPIAGQGFSKTLTYTVVSEVSNDLTLGSDVAVNTYTTSNQSASATATLSGGNVVVAWQSAGQGGKSPAGNSGIYGQLISSVGAKVGNEFLISNIAPAYDEITPAVSALNSDRYVVAYSTSGGGTGYDIEYRIVAANGTVGTPFRVNTTLTGDQSFPSIATLSDGSFVIAWSSGNGDVRARRFDAAGAAMTGEVLFADGAVAGGYFSAVTGLTSGSYVVSWVDNNTGDVFVRVSGASAVDSGIVSNYYAGPRLAGLTGGGFVVASEALDSGTNRSQIEAARYNNSGVLQGSRFQVNTLTAGNRIAASLAPLSGGGFVVGWAADNGDFELSGIFGRRFSAAGVAVDAAEFEINQHRAGDQSYPTLAPLPSNAFAATWTDTTAASIAAGTNLGDVEARVLLLTPPPTASIAVAPASVAEDGASNLVYTVTLSATSPSATIINISTSGTASSGSDYTGAVATLSIPANTASATITIDPTVDGTVEADESVILTVASGSGYTVGAPAAVTGTILNDDQLAPSADLAISKTDGTSAVTAGNSTTYTITASNAGPSNAPSVTVADNFPGACIAPSWTCVGSGGGACSAAGSGNISDAAALPVGASVIYTAVCPVSSFASGSLSNTATVSSATADPNGGNNSATDSDSIVRPVTSVLSLNRASGNPRNAPSATWTITFANPVAGLTAGNFAAVNAGLGGAIVVSAPTESSGPPSAAWNVTVSTGTGSGTLGLNLVNDTGITHSVGNLAFIGQVFTIDRTAPSATITVLDANLVAGETSPVSIVFNEVVTGFDATDLSIENGAVLPLQTTDSITFTTTLTPTAAIVDPTNVITLAANSVLDTVSNPNTASVSNNYAIDTRIRQISINDVAITEGNAGTSNLNFTVSLSLPAANGGVSFNIATQNGTAVAPSDYVAKTQNGAAITEGASSFAFAVQVNGDALVEANETLLVNLSNVIGATVLDGQGQGTINNDDTAGIILTQSSGSTDVTEGGVTDSYTMVLASQPSANVSIALTGTQVSAAPSPLIFTSANWNVPQTVTVTAINDAIAEGAHSGSVAHAVSSSDPNYNNFVLGNVAVAITDNDSAGVTIAQTGGSTLVTEGGATDSYTLVLTSEPTSDVTLSLTGTQVSATPSALTFSNLNWNVAQTVTVSAIDDAIAEGAHNGSISHSASGGGYNAVVIANITANITDNDSAGMTVTPTSGLVTTEMGGSASFSVVLTSQPTANVSIDLSSSDATEGSVSPQNLSFTALNWNVLQTVTVTGVDDAIVDGNIAYSVLTAAASSADSFYNGVNPADVSVTNNDNDNDPIYTPGAAITRQQGSAASTGNVGTVSDMPDAAGSLTVTAIAGGSAVGVSVSGVVNNNGAVSAQIAASCTAVAGTLRFRVADSGGLTDTDDLVVDVSANTPPVLNYGAQNVALANALTFNPSAAPSDNGSVPSVVLQSAGSFTGTVSVNNSSGAISLINAQPVGTHTLTIRSTDNCGATTDSAVTVTVGQASTFKLITSNVSPSRFGEAVTFSVALSGVNPTGTVEFFAGATSLGTAPLVASPSGGANLKLANMTTSTLAVGSSVIKAVYAGDVNNIASTSADLAHIVNAAGTRITLTPAANPAPVGNVSIAIQVAPEAPGGGIPAGSVTLSSGASSCGAALTAGAGSCALNFASVGYQAISASYTPTGSNHAASIGASAVVIVASPSSTDLRVRIGNGVSNIGAGQALSYLIVVDNLGTQAAVGRLQVPVSADFAGASYTCISAALANCAASGTGNIDQELSLAPGGVVIYRLQVTAPLAPERTLSQTASITTKTPTTDPDASNNSAADIDPMGLLADGYEDAAVTE